MVPEYGCIDSVSSFVRTPGPEAVLVQWKFQSLEYCASKMKYSSLFWHNFVCFIWFLIRTEFEDQAGVRTLWNLVLVSVTVQGTAKQRKILEYVLLRINLFLVMDMVFFVFNSLAWESGLKRFLHGMYKGVEGIKVCICTLRNFLEPCSPCVRANIILAKCHGLMTCTNVSAIKIGLSVA